MVPALRPDTSNNAAASTLASTARLDASSSMPDASSSSNLAPHNSTNHNHNHNSSVGTTSLNKQDAAGSSSKRSHGSSSSQANHPPTLLPATVALSRTPTPAVPTDALNNKVDSAPRGTPLSEHQLTQGHQPSLAMGDRVGLGASRAPAEPNVQGEEEQAELEDDNDIASDVQERSLGENDDQQSLHDQGDDEGFIQGPVDDQMDFLESAAAAAVAAAALQQQQQQQQQQQPSGSGGVQSTTTGKAAEDAAMATSQGDPSEEGYPQESYTSPHHEWARVLQRRLNKGLTDAQLLARSNSMLASPSIIAQSLTKAIPRLHGKDGQPGATPQERPHQTAEELFDRPAALDPSPVHYHESSKRDEAFPSTLDALGSTNNMLLFAPLDPDQLYGKSPSAAAPPPPPAAPPAQPAPALVANPPPPAAIAPAPAVAKPVVQSSKDAPVAAMAPAAPTTATATAPVTDAALLPPTQPSVLSHQHPTAPTSSIHTDTTPTINPVVQDTPGGPLPIGVPAVQVTPTEALTSSAPPATSVSNVLGAPVALEISHSPEPQVKSPTVAQAMATSATAGGAGSVGASSLPPHSGASANHLINYPTSHLTYTPQTQYKANPSKKTRDASMSERKPVSPLDEDNDAAVGVSSEKNGLLAGRDDTTLHGSAGTGLAASVATRPRAGSESLVSLQDSAVKDWATQTMSGFADVNVDVSLSVGQPILQTLTQSPISHVANIIQSPFEADPSDSDRPAIGLRANSYPIERSNSVRGHFQPPAASHTVFGTLPSITDNVAREQLPGNNMGAPPSPSQDPALGPPSRQQMPASAQPLAPIQGSLALQPGSLIVTPASQILPAPVVSAAMPVSLPQTQLYQGSSPAHPTAYTHVPLVQVVPMPVSATAAVPPSVPSAAVSSATSASAPTVYTQGHWSDHRIGGGGMPGAKEAGYLPPHSAPASTERPSIDNQSGKGRQENVGVSQSAPPVNSAGSNVSSGTPGVPWLPQSQPLLPPKLDINMIDVPALAGKQLLPMDPRPLPPLPESQKCFQFGHIAKAIRFWGRARPNASAFAVMDGKGVTWGSWTWGHILGKAEMIAKNILEKTQLKPGARVILIYRLSEILEFVAALYGAFLAGVVPVLLNQTQEYSEINYVFAATRSELVLTTEQSHKILHQGMGTKRGPSWPRTVSWWTTDGMGTWSPKDKKEKRPSIRAHELAIIEYTKSATGELKGVATSHRSLLSQCRTLLQSFAYRVPSSNSHVDESQKGSESSPLSPLSPVDQVPGAPLPSSSRSAVPPETLDQCIVASWLESRQQVGLWLTSIMGAFCGNFTVFMDSSITSHPHIYVGALGMLKANIAFGDYQGMRTLLGNLRSNPQAVLNGNAPNLSKLRAFYAHTQTCHPRLNIEFLEELLGPLGMCNNAFKSSPKTEQSAEDAPATAGHGPSMQDEAGENRATTPPGPSAASEEMVLPRGVIAFTSLPEHGGPVIGLRDELGPPEGIEAFDLRKRYRKSSFPPPRSALASSAGTSGAKVVHEPPLTKLKSSSTSSMTQCVYLLHRGALRANRIVVLAAGQDALRRADEPGTLLVGAVGYPVAKSTILIVDPETMALSLPDEVGEIWFSSSGMPAGYWNLSEHTKEVFHAEPLLVNEETMAPEVYRPPGCDKMLRTGLLGTLIEGRLVIFGTYNERLKQDAGDPLKPRGLEFEYHHASDLTHTLRSRVRNAGELCVFSCLVNNEHLPVVCIEIAKDPACTNPSARAKAIGQTAADTLTDVNGLRSYCIAVWEPNELPRILSNGRRVLDLALTKRMFELGRIPHMLYLATYTDGVILNLPHGDDPIGGVWGQDCIAKRQQRMGVPAQHLQFTSNVTIEDPVDERQSMPLNKFHNITDILMWRTIVQPDDAAYIELDHRGRDHKVTSFKKLNHKVTGVATYLEKKHQLKAGDHVILWFSTTMDLIITLHACWVMGVIAIILPAPGIWNNTLALHAHAASVTNLVNLTAATIPSGPGASASHPAGHAIEEERTSMLLAMLHIMDEVKVKAVIGNNHSEDLFKGKTFSNQLRAVSRPQSPLPTSSFGEIILPPFVNIARAGKTTKILGLISGFLPRKEWLGSSHPATILYDLHARPESSSSRRLLKLTHEGMTALARNQKLQSMMTTGQPILTCLSAFSGLGFVQACLAGVYNGSPTLLLHPGDFLTMPTIWMEAVARHNVQHASLTYPMVEHLLSRLDVSLGPNPTFSLESLKNLMITFDGRAMRELNTTIAARLSAFKFASSAISMTYGTPLDIMTSSRAGTGIGPVRLHVSTRQLRHGIIQPTSEGDDPTGIWLEDSGSIGVLHTIAIVHPETFEICPINQVGEIWICADSTVNQFYGHTVQAAINAGNYSYLPFNACANYDQRVRYVRTGDLGFVWNAQLYHLQQHQGQQPQGIVGHHHHHLQQLFVLGSMASSFQVNGLLHFATDIEATVESAHANVASQGCVAFKTNKGRVVVVVKVQHQETERLLPMYIPLMHAILEQHQFVPDVIALVGDDVSTSRGVLDGCKPRMHLQTMYQTGRLPTLHEHYCHGRRMSHQQQGSSLDAGLSEAVSYGEHHGQHPSHPRAHSSMQHSAPGDETIHFGQQALHVSGADGSTLPPPPSQATGGGGMVAASPQLTSAVLLAPLTGSHHHFPAHSGNNTVLAAATALVGGMPPAILYTPTGRPTSLILPSTLPPISIIGGGPSSAGAIPSSASGASVLHAHYPSASTGGGSGGAVHPLQYVHGTMPPPHSHPRSISATGRAGTLEDFSRPSGSSQYMYYHHQQQQPLQLNGGGGSLGNMHNASGDASSIHSQKSGYGVGVPGDKDNSGSSNKKGAAVKNLVKGMNARLTEMRKASLT